MVLALALVSDAFLSCDILELISSSCTSLEGAHLLRRLKRAAVLHLLKDLSFWNLRLALSQALLHCATRPLNHLGLLLYL